MFKWLTRSFKSFMANLYWYSAQGRWGVKQVFDDLYDGQSKSSTFRGFFGEVFGSEYAAEVDQCGFVTMTDLRNFACHLNVDQDNTFADLACGAGGNGLWVARQTGAKLVGIDISEVAVQAARRRVAGFGLEGRATFRTGDFAQTGCPPESFDGAMSVDSLFLVPDKTGSIRETSRILRPQARFVFTTWELDVPRRVKDYRPLLEQAGFEIQMYDETAGWKQRQLGIHQRILAQQDALIAEMGEPAARVWIGCAETETKIIDQMRRIFVVAVKR